MKFCRPLFALALCDKTKTSFLTRGGFPACRQAGFASFSFRKENEEKKKSKL
jgi:hypothetical protein